MAGIKGRHDDRVMALALANMARQNVVGEWLFA
jgi:hypothetical protein